uniref:Uncharacterized protein n=1 Tax=Romanomermis culicivorax TaxID=13658 RepID=A0A915L9X2_ROMCU
MAEIRLQLEEYVKCVRLYLISENAHPFVREWRNDFDKKPNLLRHLSMLTAVSNRKITLLTFLEPAVQADT